MKDCQYCKELNEEKKEIQVEELYIAGAYYKWDCKIRHCPYCGKKLKKYNNKT